MKILVLSNLYPPDVLGGYEIACKQAAEALRALGHDVLTLTSIPRSPVPADPHVRRTLRLADVWDLPWRRTQSNLSRRLEDAAAGLVDPGNVHELAHVVDDFAPHVVYVSGLVGLGGLGMLACLHHLGVPWVWHLGDNVPRYLATTFEKLRPPLATPFARQFRGRYLACSSRLVEQIESSGVPLGDAVEVVPYWISGPRPAPRARHFQKGDPLRLISAGRVAPEKGLHILIEALGLLKSQNVHGVSVDVYGAAEGVEPDFYASLIRKHDVNDRVHLHGPRPHADLAPLYASHDVMPFPTWDQEPFGIAPLEAASFGCVPLISEDCGLAEWLVHGAHCIKSERSAPAFAQALHDVLSGRIDLAPIARRAAVTACRDFHLDAVAPRIELALLLAAQTPSIPRPAAEAYRLACLAEKLANLMIQEGVAAEAPSTPPEAQRAIA